MFSLIHLCGVLCGSCASAVASLPHAPAVLLPCSNRRGGFHVLCRHTQAHTPAPHSHYRQRHHSRTAQFFQQHGGQSFRLPPIPHRSNHELPRVPGAAHYGRWYATPPFLQYIFVTFGQVHTSLCFVARIAQLQLAFDFTPTRPQYPPLAPSYQCQLLPLPLPSSCATSMRPAFAEPIACKRVSSSP